MNATEEVFNRYQAIRNRLPVATENPSEPILINNLGDVESEFDVFLFDAFGVLNVGETVIEGAVHRFNSLKNAGKKIYILTNAASYMKPDLLSKFLRLGFDVDDENIISSREVLIKSLCDSGVAGDVRDFTWGVITIFFGG